MCSIPPIPPPPPPSSLSDINSNTKVSKNSDISPTIAAENCQWASEHPELREACARNGICVEKQPFKYKYKYFQSISQVGPTCGLVALSMLTNGKLSPSTIFTISKLDGYTNNGEILSCKNMVNLGKKVFSLAGLNNIIHRENGGLFSSETVERLLNGAVLLVSYDADCNHSPCLRNGHTAHWALICGIIIVEDPGNTYEASPGNIFVLCKHGKSKYLAVWDLADLDKSNKNLREFSPKKGADGLVYVLPEGGIGGENGLRDQFIVFEGL